jgi:hypothetical protein
VGHIGTAACRRQYLSHGAFKVTTSDCPDYKELKNLAQELGRPAESMCPLDVKNDPFYIGTTRQKAAHWFHRLWQELGLTAGSHIRRVHYRLVSIEGSALFDGRSYENTDMCFKVLCTSGRDARHLGLIPAEFIIDRRNPIPSSTSLMRMQSHRKSGPSTLVCSRPCSTQVGRK